MDHDTTHAGTAAIVRGRAGERRLVRDLLQRAQRGIGGALLVEGEPGIGKSALLGDAVAAAAGLGFSLAVGAADPLGRAIPFLALRQALGEPFARLATEQDERRRADAPMWWIGRMRDHLTARAAAAPVLVCVDDLHWSRPAELAALRALARDLRPHPVAWLLARSGGPGDDSGHLFDLLEKDGAGRASLARLGHDAVIALLADALGAPPDTGLLTLAATAAGNPALLADLVAGLREERAVEVVDGQATLTADRLPGRLRQAARTRLDGLGPEAGSLLVTASALGPAFGLDDAAAMLGRTSAALLPAVAELMVAGLLTAADDAFSFRQELLRRAVRDTIPAPGLRALQRQYGQLLLGRGDAARAAGYLLRAADGDSPGALAELDAAAAQALGPAPQAAADLAARALELTAPGRQDELPRAVAAAEALAAAGRIEQAVRVARDALARPLPPVAEGRLRCALSSALAVGGRPRDAVAEAGLVLAQPDLPRPVRDAALAAQLTALAGLRGEGAATLIAPVLAARARFDDRVAPADQTQADDRSVLAALAAGAALQLDHGRIGDGLELLRDAVRGQAGVALDARHLPPLLGLAAALIDLRLIGPAEELLRATESQPPERTPARAAARLLRARIHLAAGRPGDAAAAAGDALAIAEAIGADGHASAAHCLLGLIALRQGDLTAAAMHVAGGSVAGPHLAEGYARAEVTMAAAQVSEARDGPAAALGHLRQVSAELAAHPGLLLGDPATAPWLTRAALAAGHPELAAVVAAAAVALARAAADRAPTVGSALDGVATRAAAPGRAADGCPAVDAAAAHSRGLADRDTGQLAEAAGLHPDQWARASAAEDLGIEQTRQGQAGQAIERLTEAIEGYQAVGAAADAARVRRRLRKLGVRRRHWTQAADRPTAGWESLTETECAVAELVAQGLSNRDVASRMYVSIHTVAFYLRQIFRKLEIRSRVELARIVVNRAVPAAGTAGS
jgi:DNA-binding CsgD family transcriptional regulator